MDAVVRRTATDFDVTGDGSAPAWAAADWLPITAIRGTGSFATKAKLLYSAAGVYCLFDCADGTIDCTTLTDGDELWTEDVVEAFFWPDEGQRVYFEYELSPLGAELPLMVPNAGGTFMGWTPWQYTAARKVRKATAARGGDKVAGGVVTGWSVEFFVPFALLKGLGNTPPKPGTRWRANLYRIDYAKSQQTLYAWSTGVRDTFHDLENFGTVTFE